MIGGIPLVDVHLHTGRLSTLKVGWEAWAMQNRHDGGVEDLYDDDTLHPDRFTSYLEAEGVDVALLMCEYSPRVTGVQSIEDNLPLFEHDPHRIRLIANVNPHIHYPVIDELERQLSLGAIAVKIHPVHGAFEPNVRELYPVYGRCEESALPVVFHCGTSNFPGSVNRMGDPVMIEDVAKDFPELQIVLAHGGRGWWYDAAAFLALMRPNIWIDLSGLPPRKLVVFYANSDLDRLARKFIFGSDWPGVPGIRSNAQALLESGFSDELLAGILHGNAERVFGLSV